MVIMAHPISDTYLDQQTARASAVLPAAGAFDSAPTALQCPGFDFVTLYLKYTRGGAGGAFKFKIEVSPDSSGSVWHQAGLYSPGTVTAGADTVSTEQREAVSYQATGASAELFVYGPVELNGTVERIRINAAETGAVGTPGTLEIKARFGSRESLSN